MDQSQFWQAAGQFENQSQQQWQQQPSLSERRPTTSISTRKNIEASCKRMEMHLRYISQRLNVKVNTEVNPNEEGQAIVTESDKIFDEKKTGRDEEKIERKEKEELKNIEASCKRMEMHLRYISQRLNVKVNTEVNPNEEGQAIVTESDKIFDEKKTGRDEEKIERKEKEELGWPPHRAKRIKTIGSKKKERKKTLTIA
ncbi:hypothetical protein LR48_Vigan03g102500 [Vigna angularis]|uniref:Uncharacterized protein n=1 Tax=Phaseolus angularis TaxID=3914 RepID=A0A0L9U488_PHAAN|nr:hypothetical protein LR48_Vigan03g102500 [Vigna angularis]